MSLRNPVILWVGALAVLGCSNKTEDNPPPPPVHGTIVDLPRGCDEIQSGIIRDYRILLEGGVAYCAINGLFCPIPRSADTGGTCSTFERPHAVCVGGIWEVECIDAGVGAETGSPDDAGADVAWDSQAAD